MPHAPIKRQAPVRPSWILGWVAGATIVAGAVALWTWGEGAEGRAIRDLPAEDRLALYARTMSNLQALCTDPKPTLRSYCTREATFVAHFDECDATCTALVQRNTGWRSTR